MNVALCGLGRAGKEAAKAILDHPDLKLAAGLCRGHSDSIGLDIGEIAQLPPTGAYAWSIDDVEDVIRENKIDVMIDFSNPAASRTLIRACHKYGVGAVICTTGFSDSELAYFKGLTQDDSFGMVYAPNVTIGINVLMSMSKVAATRLPDFDYQITEMHHRNKKDSPSATAKRIAGVLEQELSCAGDNRVPINAVRAGGYIGYHEVMAVGEYERITIVHESFSRRAFAEGAIKAARFIQNRVGWYEMEDVISRTQTVISIGDFATA
jgi:4-hydroxy-tetrahydrodipicolinate reductase